MKICDWLFPWRAKRYLEESDKLHSQLLFSLQSLTDQLTNLQIERQKLVDTYDKLQESYKDQITDITTMFHVEQSKLNEALAVAHENNKRVLGEKFGLLDEERESLTKRAVSAEEALKVSKEETVAEQRKIRALERWIKNVHRLDNESTEGTIKRIMQQSAMATKLFFIIGIMLMTSCVVAQQPPILRNFFTTNQTPSISGTQVDYTAGANVIFTTNNHQVTIEAVIAGGGASRQDATNAAVGVIFSNAPGFAYNVDLLALSNKVHLDITNLNTFTSNALQQSMSNTVGYVSNILTIADNTLSNQIHLDLTNLTVMVSNSIHLDMTNLNVFTSNALQTSMSNTVGYVSNILHGLSDDVTNNSAFARTNINNKFIGSNTFTMSLNANNASLTNGVNYGNAFSSVGPAIAAEQFGAGATASDINTLAVGSFASALQLGCTAIGATASASIAFYATALGFGATADGDSSVSIGNSSYAKETDSIAIGKSSSASEQSVALGSTTSANTNKAVAIGTLARADAQGAIAIGYSASSLSNSSVAIGPSSTVDTYQAVAFGNAATVHAPGGVAIGSSSEADQYISVAFGFGSLADGTNCSAIGSQSFAGGSNSTALGYSANASYTNSTAIGALSVATTNHQIMLGTASDTVVAPNNLYGAHIFMSGVATNGVAPPTSVLQPIGLFGSMMLSNVTNTITVGSSGVYRTLTNYQVLRTNGFIAVPGWNGGYLTNTIAGYYKIFYYVSMLPGNSDMIETEIFVNGIGREEIAGFGQFDTPARVRTISGGGILYLPAMSYVSLQLNNRSAANNIAVWRAGFTIGTP